MLQARFVHQRRAWYQQLPAGASNNNTSKYTPNRCCRVSPTVTSALVTIVATALCWWAFCEVARVGVTFGVLWLYLAAVCMYVIPICGHCAGWAVARHCCGARKQGDAVCTTALLAQVGWAHVWWLVGVLCYLFGQLLWVWSLSNANDAIYVLHSEKACVDSAGATAVTLQDYVRVVLVSSLAPGWLDVVALTAGVAKHATENAGLCPTGMLMSLSVPGRVPLAFYSVRTKLLTEVGNNESLVTKQLAIPEFVYDSLVGLETEDTGSSNGNLLINTGSGEGFAEAWDIPTDSASLWRQGDEDDNQEVARMWQGQELMSEAAWTSNVFYRPNTREWRLPRSRRHFKEQYMRSVEHVLTVGEFAQKFRTVLRWAFAHKLSGPTDVQVWRRVLLHVSFNITCEMHLGPGRCQDETLEDMHTWVRYVGTSEARVAAAKLSTFFARYSGDAPAGTFAHYWLKHANFTQRTVAVELQHNVLAMGAQLGNTVTHYLRMWACVHDEACADRHHMHGWLTRRNSSSATFFEPMRWISPGVPVAFGNVAGPGDAGLHVPGEQPYDDVPGLLNTAPLVGLLQLFSPDAPIILAVYSALRTMNRKSFREDGEELRLERFDPPVQRGLPPRAHQHAQGSSFQDWDTPQMVPTDGFFTFGWGHRMCPGLALIRQAVRALTDELPQWRVHASNGVDLTSTTFAYLAHVPTNADGEPFTGYLTYTG